MKKVIELPEKLPAIKTEIKHLNPYPLKPDKKGLMFQNIKPLNLGSNLFRSWFFFTRSVATTAAKAPCFVINAQIYSVCLFFGGVDRGFDKDCH